ncbi:hypothetical protein PHYBLDRAFT_146283 [Phycomyces blakesleeanus NRRL 1555(-)]|uniref:Tc1-like transposase DDE domain-containing protein n=1 Tax=Phycomyces blakesleeanus (strain ATCC 8743b / DSM 1359 / FGSC 10004 / NBRC 33097 / NRRL 1555) TaxID=763407 RepID=A0A167MJ10_PHYB8|nr:hypothetical protein PHYBLDRAFT_146283 [Phycomyces blakesleeanus NRRL 1555(-)]OAD72969.1 hypothetical protein PHYBLDRAFT_146283 [Phycomyces blakesleeanus NRRL 1555(-)]|eukprot:XP_018291009.1 hypothetical protein PHYBLDRAFT_146283 [Phycomyces blakesleeanus NRRL 1555(-)]
MDYISNCVFVDEAAFHINLKRSMAARTTATLDAILPPEILNIQLHRPTMPFKKILGSNVLAYLERLNNHEEFKEDYIVMDNVPVHTSKVIKRYITSRDYGCIYLPSYSPEFNPIEEFWSIVKIKPKIESLVGKRDDFQ